MGAVGMKTGKGRGRRCSGSWMNGSVAGICPASPLLDVITEAEEFERMTTLGYLGCEKGLQCDLYSGGHR